MLCENQRNRGMRGATSTAIVARTIAVTIASTYLRIPPPLYHRSLCRISSLFLFCSGTVVIPPPMTQTQHTITHHSLSADAPCGGSQMGPIGVNDPETEVLCKGRIVVFFGVERRCGRSTAPFVGSLKGKRVNAYLALLRYASRDIRFRRAMREKRKFGPPFCGPRTV